MFPGGLSSINDVDGADYTGFSLLGEDLLGDLFGSSGSKKTNKNKKKQAPAPTTTTRRPRPSRRPTRKPITRTTTPKPTKLTTTTLKVRPVTRRPTRKPVRRRRPTKKPTTALVTAESVTSATATPAPLAVVPVITAAPVAPSTERSEHVVDMDTDQTFAPIMGFSQKLDPALYATTAKPVTGFEDSGLQISLAHITGQLSNMPATPIVSNTAKESSMPSTNPVIELNYEKVETITPKMPSTAAFPTTSQEKVNDAMIQIVQDLDSHSEESTVHVDSFKPEESRTHSMDEVPVMTEQPKKKQRGGFNFRDLDVLDLTEIGETVGDELGIFGKNKRQNRDHKPQGHDGSKEDDYSDLLSLDNLDSLLRKSSDAKNKKDRRRQNKMMRGEWSHV